MKDTNEEERIVGSESRSFRCPNIPTILSSFETKDPRLRNPLLLSYRFRVYGASAGCPSGELQGLRGG